MIMILELKAMTPIYKKLRNPKKLNLWQKICKQFSNNSVWLNACFLICKRNWLCSKYVNQFSLFVSIRVYQSIPATTFWDYFDNTFKGWKEKYFWYLLPTRNNIYPASSKTTPILGAVDLPLMAIKLYCLLHDWRSSSFVKCSKQDTIWSKPWQYSSSTWFNFMPALGCFQFQ